MGWGTLQVFDVLETISEVAEEGVVEMLEHAALADDVADTFRPYHCYTASALGDPDGGECDERTFILAYVLEGEGEPGVFSLDDADFAKGALADDAQQTEVVEVH